MCAVIVVVLCFVIGHINTLSIVDDDSMQHSFKTNFDRRFRNMEDNLSKVANRLDNYGRNLNHNVGAGSGDNYATRNGAPSRSNGANNNIQGSISNNGPQDGAPRRFNNGDYNFPGSRSNNEPQSGALGRSNNANHNVQGTSNNYEPQDGAPSRSNNANNNFQDSSNNYRRQNDVLDPGQVNQIAPLSASDSNYGSYGAQNIADSGTAPLRNSRAHTKPRNCNVQAWNEKFDRIEGRLGFANSGSHSNPTVRCREETVVRGKDFGNGVVVHSTNTVGTGSYRSHVHRNVGDADAEALAKQFGSF